MTTLTRAFCAVLAALCGMVSSLSAAKFGNFDYIDNGTSITITGYRFYQLQICELFYKQIQEERLGFHNTNIIQQNTYIVHL